MTASKSVQASLVTLEGKAYHPRDAALMVLAAELNSEARLQVTATFRCHPWVHESKLTTREVVFGCTCAEITAEASGQISRPSESIPFDVTYTSRATRSSGFQTRLSGGSELPGLSGSVRDGEQASFETTGTEQEVRANQLSANFVEWTIHARGVRRVTRPWLQGAVEVRAEVANSERVRVEAKPRDRRVFIDGQPLTVAQGLALWVRLLTYRGSIPGIGRVALELEAQTKESPPR